LFEDIDYSLTGFASNHVSIPNLKEGDPVEAIREMTNGRGADVVVDAVGMEANRNILQKATNLVHFQMGTLNALKLCFSAVRRGGKVTIVGVYGTNYDNFPLGQLIDKGITIWGGQAPVQNYIDELIQLVKEKKVFLDDIITHRLPLAEGPHAYHLFNAKEDHCLKVILKPHG
jgi:threonine dehydrogenase-like Zn-dependent dehydrogenase